MSDESNEVDRGGAGRLITARTRTRPPPLRGPLRIDGQRIHDTTGAVGQLRGAVLPNLDDATTTTLGVMRIRWNFNTVRIPVSVAEWQRSGQAYVDRVTAAVSRARDAELITVLATKENSAAPAFWTASAAALRNEPSVVFSLAHNTAQVSTRLTAIRTVGAHQIVALPVQPTVDGRMPRYSSREKYPASSA